MIYLTGAYLIIWAASFALILSMVQRQAKIDRELEALEEVARDKDAWR